MTFLDLFAGIGGFRRGMELAGHKCLGFCEWDKYARMSYISMHCITDEQRAYLATLDMKKRQKEILKDEYLNDEWCSTDIRTINVSNIPKADCWCFGAPCLLAGTMITTDRGLKPIEQIESNDMVLTHMNRFKRVVKPMKSIKKGIYTLKVQGSPITECTGNHRFYVRYKNNNDTWTIPEWKAIKDFNGDELIEIPKNSLKEYEPLQLCNGVLIDGVLWSPIVEIKSEPYRIEVVYNMEVEDDNSYTANNMGLHNCQDFSVAGRRAGLEGDRSSLIREVFRILKEIREEDRPKWLIYENVKGMLSSNKGFDFLSILLELDEIGYDTQWQLLNTKDFGVPQNRERVYTVGCLRGRGGSEIFPLSQSNETNSIPVDQVGKDGTSKRDNPNQYRVYGVKGISPALNCMEDGGREPHIPITIKSFGIDKNVGGQPRTVANTITAREDRGVSNQKQTGTAVAIPIKII